MSQEQLQTELTKLQQENAALAQEVTALKAERDRLINAFEKIFPPPTLEELAEAEANVGGFRRLIDQMASDWGVANDGR